MKSYPTISKSKSIRECLEVIDFYAKSICYILESKKLVGIATDGDIRRALIAGASLDDPIVSIMNKLATKVDDRRQDNSLYKINLKT